MKLPCLYIQQDGPRLSNIGLPAVLLLRHLLRSAYCYLPYFPRTDRLDRGRIATLGMSRWTCPPPRRRTGAGTGGTGGRSWRWPRSCCLRCAVPSQARRCAATSGRSPSTFGPATAEVEPSLDAVAVAEKAGHALTAVPGAPGTLQVADAGYRATFDGAGVHFTPEGATSGLGIGLAAIHRGNAAVHLRPGGWSADVNIARRSVADGVREQATARRGTVEWDVVLDRPVVGRGDLVVGADLTGVAGPPRPAAGRDGLHLSLDDGTTVRLGQTVVVDATGTELYRATPTVADGRVELTVPAAVLDGAAYPLTIDPTVSGATPVSTNPAQPRTRRGLRWRGLPRGVDRSGEQRHDRGLRRTGEGRRHAGAAHRRGVHRGRDHRPEPERGLERHALPRGVGPRVQLY